MANSNLSAIEARGLFSYNPETGEMVWLIDSGKAKAGDKAGTVKHDGYLAVAAKGKRYPVHRVAWLIQFGEWPKEQIDHINGTKDDNRLCNLRDVRQSVNMHNRLEATKRRRAGRLGVSWLKAQNAWRAQLEVGDLIWVRVFATAAEAEAAYQAAKARFVPGAVAQ